MKKNYWNPIFTICLSVRDMENAVIREDKLDPLKVDFNPINELNRNFNNLKEAVKSVDMF